MAKKRIDPQTIDEQSILDIVAGKNARLYSPVYTATSIEDCPISQTIAPLNNENVVGCRGSLSEYEARFLHPGHINSRKSLHIDATIHRRICALVGAAARQDLTVSGFVNGVLVHHFEEYGELIIQFLDQHYQSLKP